MNPIKMNRKHILTQLNKVKNFSEKFGKLKECDIDAQTTMELLDAILSEENSMEGKTILVLNSDSGILHVGVGLCSPGLVASVVTGPHNEILTENLASFGIHCDFVLSKGAMFRKSVFDVAIVGPVFEKGVATDLTTAKMAVEAAKTVYCVFQTENTMKFLENLKNATVVGNLNIKIPRSSNYYQQNVSSFGYSIFRVGFS